MILTFLQDHGLGLIGLVLVGDAIFTMWYLLSHDDENRER